MDEETLTQEEEEDYEDDSTTRNNCGPETTTSEIHQQPQHNLRFSLRNWKAVATWSWDVIHDICAICRNNMTSLCVRCEASIQDNQIPYSRILSEICPVVCGACSHAYHLHCIERWLESSDGQRCPLDNVLWEYSNINNADDNESM